MIEGEESDLCRAAAAGDLATVTRLVDAGAPVNHRGIYRRTPLQHASTAEVAAFLLDRGADLTSLSDAGDVLHSQLSLRDCPELVTLYAARGLSIHRYKMITKPRPGRPRSHLATACYATRSASVAALLALEGASPDELDSEYYQPVIYAALAHEPPRGNELAIALLQAGATDLPGRGMTLIEKIAGRRDPALLGVALQRGIDPKKRSGKEPPLCIAVRAGDPEVVMLLIEADQRVDERSRSGVTPLAIARVAGHTAIVELLIQCGAT